VRPTRLAVRKKRREPFFVAISYKMGGCMPTAEHEGRVHAA
jgi:hypothetical protein